MIKEKSAIFGVYNEFYISLRYNIIDKIKLSHIRRDKG